MSEETDAMSVDDDEKGCLMSTDNQLNCEESQSHSVCVVSSRSISTPASILIESLVKNICTIYETDPKKATLMYKMICDKLYSMNFIDESYTMTEFEGMRSQYQRAFLHLVSSVKTGDKNLPLRPIWPNTEINSHYLREFEEIEYIAGGGFGQVYKVKHKLDGTEYAVKKIPIRSEGIESVRNYLSEVKTFASMNHSNIVQYKAAWLELGAPSTNKAILNHQTESLDDKKHYPTKHRERTDYIYHRETTQSFTDEENEDSTDFQIDFEHSVSGASTATHVTHSKKRQKRHSQSEGGKAICKLDMKKIEKIKSTSKSRVKWATLYIQMALCHSTLKQWLEKRNEVAEPEKALVRVTEQMLRTNSVNQILIQLLRGLQYIHSKGIVHHDIKPSNIFIQIEDNSILIQLGDFGLACPLQSVRHSLAFGTKLYAAPEQLAGKCNPKSDMYSLGIVLFELVENFKTDMERVQHITELRKGNIPSDPLIKHPDLIQVIVKLIAKNPDDRPNPSTLLNDLRSSESQQIEQLKMQVAEKDEEILYLKERLKSLGIKSV